MGKIGRRLLQDLAGGVLFLVLVLHLLDSGLVGTAPARPLSRKSNPRFKIPNIRVTDPFSVTDTINLIATTPGRYPHFPRKAPEIRLPISISDVTTKSH